MSTFTRLFNIAHPFWRNRLTVLAYHRIADPESPEFDTFKPNVSATPQGFAAQMEFVARHFHVISAHDLVCWLRDLTPLPPHPLLITFDDGYRDNYVHAWPALKARGLPAVIYLTTGFLDTRAAFYWDRAAYCFAHTSRTEADLPLTGRAAWGSLAERDLVVEGWLEAVKRRSEEERRDCLNRLPAVLGVEVPDDLGADLALTWDQVREMAAGGGSDPLIEIGAHTCTHPILTRIPLDEARDEIATSKARIEAEIGRPAQTFAYTNGTVADFNDDLQCIVRELGFEAAFTLIAGPEPLSEVRRAPLAISRTYIGGRSRDTLDRFLRRLIRWPSRKIRRVADSG